MTAATTARRRSVRVGFATLIGLALALALLAVPAEAQVSTGPPVGVDVELETLTTETQDPTVVAPAPDGRVIFAERKGAVKVWHQDGSLVEAGRVPVGANSCEDCPDSLPEEGGIHGLLLDPDFTETGELYLYYSVPDSVGEAPEPAKHPDAGGTGSEEGIWRLSRFQFDLDADELLLDTEEPILENPGYWEECCHYAGDLEWMDDGTILLSIGDDTNPHASNGYAPRDKREGREAWDADRTAQNPADRRGKILRLLPDGSVPDGSQEGVAPNPHVDDPDFDPYVYAMGVRNPYRISVHQPSQTMFLGNVGPDAFFPDEERGPAGHDELEAVPAGGGTNHGWPRCKGDNQPYRDYDFETGESGDWLSCEDMTPAEVWYPYTPSTDFPTLATGLRSMMAGPVYDYDGDGALALPDRYHGHLILIEWMRNVLYTAPVADDGTLETDQVLPFMSAERVIDADIGPDGAVYVAMYGTAFYDNSNSQIARIICRGCGANDDGLDADQMSGVGITDSGGPGIPAAILLTGLLLALATAGIRLRTRVV